MKPHIPHRVVIPLLWQNGQWQCEIGPMPEIKPGTKAELYLHSTAFKDEREIQQFSHAESVALLPKGFVLLACMTLKKEHPKEAYRFPNDKIPLPGIGYPHFFIPFSLEEALLIRLRGTKKAQLEPCKCRIPALDDLAEVDSVNQAYTRISEKYEPWRKSHTGDVFQKVYLAELQNKSLVSLGELRTRIQKPSTP